MDGVSNIWFDGFAPIADISIANAIESGFKPCDDERFQMYTPDGLPIIGWVMELYRRDDELLPFRVESTPEEDEDALSLPLRGSDGCAREQTYREYLREMNR